MIARMLLICALCNLLSGTTSHIVSTQTGGRYFEFVDGARSQNGVLVTAEARSMGECALMCAHENVCSEFNFGFGQCQLLSGSVLGACRRTQAPGWNHGYYPTGKYKALNFMPPGWHKPTPPCT